MAMSKVMSFLNGYVKGHVIMTKSNVILNAIGLIKMASSKVILKWLVQRSF